MVETYYKFDYRSIDTTLKYQQFHFKVKDKLTFDICMLQFSAYGWSRMPVLCCLTSLYFEGIYAERLSRFELTCLLV